MLDETNNFQANGYQIQNTLGKLEIKMDNQGDNLKQVSNQMHEMKKEVTGKFVEMEKNIHKLNIDVTEIKTKQNPAAHRWPAVLMAILGCITAAAVVITLIITITKP